MTVKRQYTLPYCNLIIEGLGASANDPFSPLTVLMNAECQLPGVTDVSLTGGREFLESLVAAVSRYGQQILSGVARPTASPDGPPPVVDMKPGEGDYHHLIVRQQALGEPVADTQAMPPLDVKLTTVQFYDLMEAIDQLLADTQTLPDLTAQFQAVSRRLVKPAEPVTKRAAPAAIGAAALAAAGLALFFVPPPEFEPSRSGRETDTPAETSTANPPDGLATDNLDQLASAPAITDADTLERLRANLAERLQTDWNAESPPSDDLTYRVVVAEDGEILGYKYENDLALAEVDNTPLANLSFDAAAPTDTETPSQSVAQFLATFTPAGRVLVEPWGTTAAASSDTEATETEVPEAESEPASTDTESSDTESSAIEETGSDVPTLETADSEPSESSSTNPSGTNQRATGGELETLEDKITDGDRLRQLNSNLRSTLAEELEQPTTNEDLTYRVRLNSAGEIVGYEAVNTAAVLLAKDTPLPRLVAPSQSGGQQADFKVVFTEDGVIQVSPWEGWPQ